jgi:hypothetical protein
MGRTIYGQQYNFHEPHNYLDQGYLEDIFVQQATVDFPVFDDNQIRHGENL